MCVNMKNFFILVKYISCNILSRYIKYFILVIEKQRQLTCIYFDFVEKKKMHLEINYKM